MDILSFYAKVVTLHYLNGDMHMTKNALAKPALAFISTFIFGPVIYWVGVGVLQIEPIKQQQQLEI